MDVEFIDMIIKPKFRTLHINNRLVVLKFKTNLYYSINIFNKMRIIVNTFTIVLQYKIM